ncbi:MAG: hypothetical protein H5T65_11045 [Chloroflexi bacterium]|nr:hypothetical protein [Chloroflexota bacterium]
MSEQRISGHLGFFHKAFSVLILLILGLSACAARISARRGETPTAPVLTLTFTPLAQPSPSAGPASQPITWEKQFDNNGRADLAADVMETPQGDLVVVGVTGPTPCLIGCNVDGWIIKINARGDLLWTRQVGGNGADVLTSVILKGNDYWITGSKYVFPNAHQAWLLEIAPDGRVVWEKTLGGSQDDFTVDTIPTPDGNFLMIGTTRSYGVQDGGDVWLVKLDSDGGMIWSKTYDLGAEDGGTSLIAWGTDRYLLTAKSCTANCRDLLTPQLFATYLVMDANGDVLKKQTFNEGLKNKFDKIKPTRDGGAVITGATSMQEKFPSEDTWIVKLDANADVAWTKIFTSFGRYDGGFDIVQMPDDGYVVAAYSQVEQTAEMKFDNFWMLRLDSAGEMLWSRTWGGPDNDDLRSVVLTADGGVVLAGFKDAVSWPLDRIPGPADFYVIKTTAGDRRTFLPCVLRNDSTRSSRLLPRCAR